METNKHDHRERRWVVGWLWFGLAGCAGPPGAAPRPEAPQANEVTAQPAPPTSEATANEGSAPCKFVAGTGGRCFASMDQACRALGCPAGQCDQTFSYPASVSCRTPVQESPDEDRR